MKKNFFFALIFVFEFAKSQTPEKFAPVLNPPSPEAASLGKYGDVPVSYYNGLPEISIPFESIITKSGFELPISVSYYSSGIRIDDMPSLIGMGWSLNAGGAIIRNIRGTDDFSLYGYYNNKQVQGPNDIPPCSAGSFLSYALQKVYDLEPDQFLYNVGNFGGKFVFNENKQCSVNGLKNIKVDVGGYSPIRASDNYNNIGTITQLEMRISDEKGNIYFFEPSGNEITYNSQSNGTTGNVTKSLSSCFLTKIQLNNGEYIQFNYEQNTIKYNSSRNHSHGYLVLDNWDTQCDPYIDMTSITITESHTKLLKSISYGNYTIEFDHQPANLANTEGVKKLISIKYKYNNNIYNSYGFNYLDDFVKERFWLTGIKKFDVSNSSNFIEYKLEYKDPTSLPGRLSSSQDHWGFFNSNPAFRTDPNIPITCFPLSLGFNEIGLSYWFSHQPDFFGVDRNPDLSKYQIGTLKKIIYPTKGVTEFEFEPNQFEPTPFLSLTFGAGLRIKQMRNFSNQNQLSKTTVFEYGLGKLMSEPKYFYNYIIGYPQGIYDKRCVYTKSTSTSVVSLSTSASGGLVGYNEVIVKEVDENGNENGKTSYAFINEPSITATSTSSIFGYNIPMNPALPVTEFSYKNGTLLECNIFKNISGNTSLVKRIKNFYSEKYSTMIPASIFGEKDMILSGNENCTDIYSCRYGIANGFMRLDEVEEYNYENIGFRKNHSWYSYNNSVCGLLLAGENTNGVYTDYNYLTTNIDNRNPNYRLKILTSKITTRGNNILNHELYDYNNNYQPIKVTTKSSQNLGNSAGNISTLENVSEKLFKYSNNLIEKVDEQNGNNESYLWDNNIIKPIAKCVNAELYDVAYTSFENDNAKGRFDYINSSIDNINSRTGKKAYTLINTSTLSTSIKSSGTYKFSVWVRNGTSNFSLYVNTDISGVIINSTPSIENYPNYEWSLYTYTLTKNNDLVTNVSLNGNAIIDELRLSPINSEFTTFTYVPYYGITSVSDNRGQVTTYEYDGFGKLFRMKDHEGNIINELRYNNKQ